MDQNEPSMESWNGNSARNWFNYWVLSRRIGYVAKKDKIKGKSTERGFLSIMIGYAANSSTGTYQM